MPDLLLQETLSWMPFATYRSIMARYDCQPCDYNGTIIDAIKPSTITVGGLFTNIVLNEKTDVPKFEAVEPIVQIGSNYGELFATGYKPPEKKIKTSKRGRKPKIKEPKKRIQGSGKYFNSQITYVIRSPANPNKLYKFKVFRNGKFQVPGVLSTDQDDIELPLQLLRQYFTMVYKKDVQVVEKVVQMRNCKTILSDPDLVINTLALGALISQEMQGANEMKINKVEYQTAQNSSKVVVKFLRPTKDKPNKQTTLKILKQKINFEGAVGFDGVNDIYWWLNDILLDNYYQVINDPLAPSVASDSSDTDEESSSASEHEDITPGVAAKSFAFNPYAF